MSGRGLEIRPLEAAFGAQVIGADPADELDEQSHATIRQALHRHRVLLFRNERRAPRPDPALVAFARRFGPLITLYDHETTVPGHPEIVRVSNVEEAGRPIGLAGEQAIPWHHDHPYLECPAKESFLQAMELPADPPKTSFVDMAAALSALPAALRERLRGLHAVHHIDERPADPGEAPGLSGTCGVTPDYTDETNVLAQERIAAQRATHPILVRHPDSGLAALYVSPLATHEIVGLAPAEAEALLAELFERALRPEHVYTHEWSPGDFVVWDTIATLHGREAFEGAGRRLMNQLSSRCERPLEAAA